MDFLDEKKLFCRAKSIITSLYGLILWSTTVPFSMLIPKQYFPLSPGLKTLIFSQEESPTHHPFIIHSHKILSSSSLPPSPTPTNTCSSLTDSSPCSSSLDDLIGTDSGACLTSNEQELVSRIEELRPCNRNSCKRKCEIGKKYPPPIPSLARTGNLPGHMPWILTRQYSDGRLILREERLKNHEYFEAYREDGRLILNLVRLDHTVQCRNEEEEEDSELQDLELIQEEEEREENEEDEYDEEKKEKTMAELWAKSVPKSYEIKRAEDERMCLSYAGRLMISESSYFFCNVNAHGGDQRGSTSTLPFTIPSIDHRGLAY